MPVERPTFSESWYRVVGLRPRLRSTVQIHRQRYRGQMWYVLQDPTNNQFYRQNDAAYRFVALLDGKRTIGEVWNICNEELGDGAPTQGEAIQLLGQLYTSNLIQCELPPDAQGLFSRFQKRRNREVRGYLSNLLFIRIPLFDPDHFLDRWLKFFGMAFTKGGFILWLVLVISGLYTVISNFGGLRSMSNSVLEPDNLPLLYLSFVLIKVIHEFGHAFACKKFGQLSGGGEVHVMGVMLLVFTPLPYVDASSSWAFRSKWHRVIVGAGGMLIELGVASVAAMVWANTSPGTLHSIAFNVMFIASVSTLLFNANPLLRYDGYYILSDILEIPNLSQRAKQYLYYLVRKYAWGVRNPRNPAHTSGEKAWFVFYGIASTVYRIFICARILLFVADKIFLVGFALAMAAVAMWVFVPIGKFIHYLATSGELMRVRPRAVLSTVATAAIIIGLVGFMPVHDREKLIGVVEPESIDTIFVESDGWVVEYLPNRSEARAGKDILLRQKNVELEAQLERSLHAMGELEARADLAERQRKITEANSHREQILAYRREIDYIRELLDDLTIVSPSDGTWIAPNIERGMGAYLQRGAQVGFVVDLSSMKIRCVAGQDTAQRLIRQARLAGDIRCEIRVKGRPDDLLIGHASAEDIVPGGQNYLPSPALGFAVGGSIATDPTDERGIKTMEKFFEIRINPDNGGIIPDADGNTGVVAGGIGGNAGGNAGGEVEAGVDAGVAGDGVRRLLPNQVVVVRVDMPKCPLARQWYRSLLQLIQRRFGAN